MKRAFPILAIFTALALVYASYQALRVAPTDALQGDVYRIIYYHVPSAWTAFLLFFVNFIASVHYLVDSSRSASRVAKWIVLVIGIGGCVVAYLTPLPNGMRPSAAATTALAITAVYFVIGKYFSGQRLDMLAVTTAEVGVVFCTIVLVTGPIWARPVWGIWWAPGDIRLTSTLVLWLIYVSYLVLRSFSSPAQWVIHGKGPGQLFVGQLARSPDDSFVYHFLQSARPWPGLATDSHCASGDLGAGREWDILRGDLAAHPQPGIDAAVAVVSDFHSGCARNGCGYHRDSHWRKFRALLDRIASHLRCGVYYCLSGIV